MRPSEIVHRFLASMGRPAAVAQYLRIFQETNKEQFALLFMGDYTLSNSSSALIADLLFLQTLELTPVLCVDSQAAHEHLAQCLPPDLRTQHCQFDQIRDVAHAASIPTVIAPSSQARQALVQSLVTRKVIYLIDQSGLQPKDEAVRSLVNLRTDYQCLAAPDVLPAPQRALLSEVRELFSSNEHTFTVSVTSPEDLLRELFTVKGAGTLLRRGTDVERLPGYSGLVQERFTALMRSAFSRPLAPDFYERPVLQIFLAAQYRGAAIVENRGIAPYLSKFAVDLRAQGEGIGGDLWRALCQDYPRFYWRSRPGNPIASWYASECDGLVRGNEWTVYWRGLQTNEIEGAVALANRAPVDFESKT